MTASESSNIDPISENSAHVKDAHPLDTAQALAHSHSEFTSSFLPPMPRHQPSPISTANVLSQPLTKSNVAAGPFSLAAEKDAPLQPSVHVPHETFPRGLAAPNRVRVCSLY